LKSVKATVRDEPMSCPVKVVPIARRVLFHSRPA